MDFLLSIGAIIVFFVFVIPVILFVRTSNLGSRMSRIEEQLAKISKGEFKEPTINSERDDYIMRPTPPLGAPIVKPTGPPAPYISTLPNTAESEVMGSPKYTFEPDWNERFISWLKDDWLLKLGALLILIGFGWFVTYAFLHNWIDAIGRITLGLIAGSLILVLGFWRIRKYLNQGGVFIVLGSTVILLTTFAAREVYDFFDPISALVIMFMSTALVAFASVKYQSRNLAFSSLILASIAPLLTKSTDPTHIALFSYLVVVVLATLWIVVLCGWRELVTASLIVVALYGMPDLFGYSSADPNLLIFFIYAFVAIFFVTHTLGSLKSKSETISADLVTASLNGLLVLLWIWNVVPHEWRSSIISAWMVVFAVGGFSVFRVTGKREPFYIYLGVSVAMLAAATAAELSGAALTIAYTIESAFIPAIAYAVLRKREESESLSFLIIGPIVLSFSSLNINLWYDSILNRHFFVLLVLSLALFGLGGLFAWISEKEKTAKSAIATISFVLGSIYAYALIWLSLHALLQGTPQTAVMVSLVIYTIVGLITYFYGRTNAIKGLLTYGGALLAFVVGRLLLVDVWQMDLTIRIVTFFAVGALLVSTAFIGRGNNGNSGTNNK